MANEQQSIKFRMVAGEASGDMLAALLLKGMQTCWPLLDVAGIGGGQMQARGFECWTSYEQLAVHGYVDALKNYRELSALRRKVGTRIIDEQPAAFIGIDAPDFNLGLEKRIKQAGIKTAHFVSPSIWAWRGWRVKTIKESTDLVLCLFPFEPAIYEKAEIHACYVGHPLADEIPLQTDQSKARAELNLPANGQVIAILPGSRRSEIRQLGALFLSAAKVMLRKNPDLHFVFPVAPGLMPVAQIIVQDSGISQYTTVTDGKAGQALIACDVALIASGTATLEAALYKRPMVIAYKVGAVSGLIFKRMSYLPWIGLPNILCNETVVPERVQNQANPEQLADDVLTWLSSPEKVAALKSRFMDLHQLLRQNTGKTATQAIAKLIQC